MALRIRYYVDADTIGLAKVLLRATPDVTYPGDPGGKWRGKHRVVRPACIVTDPDTKDRVWIPKIAAAGLPIITRDRHIQERRAEVRAVLDSGAKMFAVTSREQLRLLELLEVVMCNWRRMEQKAEEPGPFICSMTRTSFRQVAP